MAKKKKGALAKRATELKSAVADLVAAVVPAAAPKKKKKKAKPAVENPVKHVHFSNFIIQ